jgi:predicted small secreted protein
MHRIRILVAALLLVAFLLSGCGLENGMPRDLTDHLKARDILIQPSRIYAPLSRRGGFLVVPYDAQVAAKIISAFDLKQIPEDDPRWAATAQTIGATVTAKEIWGASGRPPQFKLKDGGQFEYFYLLVTPDGEVYLFAEYAYG